MWHNRYVVMDKNDCWGQKNGETPLNCQKDVRKCYLCVLTLSLNRLTEGKQIIKLLLKWVLSLAIYYYIKRMIIHKPPWDLINDYSLYNLHLGIKWTNYMKWFYCIYMVLYFIWFATSHPSQCQKQKTPRRKQHLNNERKYYGIILLF